MDLSIGAAIPQGGGAKSGVLFAIEPKYSIIDKFAVGLRLEAAITARGWVASDGSSASASVAASASYLATYDYYLPGLIFRPFVGGGTGIYKMASASVSADNQNNESMAASASSKFGTMFRTGFELKHFRFRASNTISSARPLRRSPTVPAIRWEPSLPRTAIPSIKFGFFFGGGKR